MCVQAVFHLSWVVERKNCRILAALRRFVTVAVARTAEPAVLRLTQCMLAESRSLRDALKASNARLKQARAAKGIDKRQAELLIQDWMPPTVALGIEEVRRGMGDSCKQGADHQSQGTHVVEDRWSRDRGQSLTRFVLQRACMLCAYASGAPCALWAALV